jgi:hypothetical protein
MNVAAARNMSPGSADASATLALEHVALAAAVSVTAPAPDYRTSEPPSFSKLSDRWHPFDHKDFDGVACRFRAAGKHQSNRNAAPNSR